MGGCLVDGDGACVGGCRLGKEGPAGRTLKVAEASGSCRRLEVAVSKWCVRGVWWGRHEGGAARRAWSCTVAVVARMRVEGACMGSGATRWRGSFVEGRSRFCVGVAWLWGGRGGARRLREGRRVKRWRKLSRRGMVVGGRGNCGLHGCSSAVEEQ